MNRCASLVAFLFECAVDQECDFLLGQKTPFGLLLRDAVREERVALQQTVIDGHIDYFPERHHIRPDRVVAVIFSTRRNNSKSVINAGVSSLNAMSLTLYRFSTNSERCLYMVQYFQ